MRVLIVDDEPLARRGIRTRLDGERDMEIAGEADDGPTAVRAIRALAPDLVFLDVQMPGLDGFAVLERLSPDALPLVVFVTAYDAHALRAFEVHALDYLLKPYSEERFKDCLGHAREAFARGEAQAEHARVRELLERLEPGRAAAGPAARPWRFAVRERDRIVFVRPEELVAVEAAGNYVTLVTAGARHLLRLTLAEMEQQLDTARFARIHRSTIVNVERVREVVPEPHGDGIVRLEGGAAYRLSRGYRERLLPRG
jgi:two-component system LytT family response regulator